jgi:hypothetical protein
LLYNFELPRLWGEKEMDHVGTEVEYPIFLVRRFSKTGRVVIYNDYESLKNHLEPIDIEDDEFLGWDAGGVALRFQIDKTQDYSHWLKVISTGIYDRVSLLETILRYSIQLGVAIALDPDDSLSVSPLTIFEQIKAKHEERIKAETKWWQFWKWLPRFLNEE